MENKEIAMQIVLKMMDLGVLKFETFSENFKADQIEHYNQECTKTVCNAYKTVYQTILQDQNS